ncbi:MAG: hypothetical protein ABI824_05375 [Acidobacteriota bacterium]
MEPHRGGHLQARLGLLPRWEVSFDGRTHSAGRCACDVVSELANMVGGNLKSIVAQVLHLSTPQVTYGMEWQPEGTREYSVTELFFRCEGGEFGIAVLAKT